ADGGVALAAAGTAQVRPGPPEIRTGRGAAGFASTRDGGAPEARVHPALRSLDETRAAALPRGNVFRSERRSQRPFLAAGGAADVAEFRGRPGHARVVARLEPGGADRVYEPAERGRSA